MSTHNVRGTASGEYECSCGARWDRDEGGRCPGEFLEDNPLLARHVKNVDSLPAPEEVGSAVDERAEFEAFAKRRGLSTVKYPGGMYVCNNAMWAEIAWVEARAALSANHSELAALKARPSGVVLPERKQESPSWGYDMGGNYDEGHADGWNQAIDEVARLNHPASAGDERAAFEQAVWERDRPMREKPPLYRNHEKGVSTSYLDPTVDQEWQARAALSADTRIVPVKLLRSLLTDVESGMMCNPDPAELQQLRALLDA